MSAMPTAKQRLRLQELSLQLFGASSRWQKILQNTKIPTQELDPKADQSGDQPVLIQTWRRPTIEEILNAFEQNAQTVALSKMPEGELLEILAAHFVAGTLPVRIAIHVPDEDQADFEEMLLLIPEDQRPAVKAWSSKTHVNQAFNVKGLDFLGELAYLANPSLKEPVLDANNS